MSLLTVLRKPTEAAVDDSILVERIELSTAVQEQDFAATLAGDTDYSYRCMFYIQSDAVLAANINLRLNGINVTVDERQRVIAVNTGISGIRSNTSVIGTTPGSGYTTIVLDIIKSATGDARHYTAYSMYDVGANIELHMKSGAITSPSVATEITGVGLRSSQPDGLGVGSIFVLYRWKP